MRAREVGPPPLPAPYIPVFLLFLFVPSCRAQPCSCSLLVVRPCSGASTSAALLVSAAVHPVHPVQPVHSCMAALNGTCSSYCMAGAQYETKITQYSAMTNGELHHCCTQAGAPGDRPLWPGADKAARPATFPPAGPAAAPKRPRPEPPTLPSVLASFPPDKNAIMVCALAVVHGNALHGGTPSCLFVPLADPLADAWLRKASRPGSWECLGPSYSHQYGLGSSCRNLQAEACNGTPPHPAPSPPTPALCCMRPGCEGGVRQAALGSAPVHGAATWQPVGRERFVA